MYALVLKGIKSAYVDKFHMLMEFTVVCTVVFVFFHVYKNTLGDDGVAISAYTFLNALLRMSFPRLAKDMNKEIRTGIVDSRILRPYSLFYQYFFEGLGRSAIMFIAGLLFLSAFAVATRSLFFFQNVPFTFILAYIAYFLYYYVVGLSVVYIGDNTNVVRILQKIDFIVIFIPKEILPQWLSSIYSILPSAFIYYYPSAISVRGGFIDVTYFIFVAFMVFTAFVFERIALKRIQVWGG